MYSDNNIGSIPQYPNYCLSPKGNIYNLKTNHKMDSPQALIVDCLEKTPFKPRENSVSSKLTQIKWGDTRHQAMLGKRPNELAELYGVSKGVVVGVLTSYIDYKNAIY